MKNSDVYFYKIDDQLKQTLFKKIDLGCENTNWFKHKKLNSIFIKINGMSSELLPGVSTSPWVFEAVLQHVRKHFPMTRIYFGDSDGYGVRQVDKMVENWGYLPIADKYNAHFVNLSKDKKVKVRIGNVFGTQSLPKTLLDVDAIVNLPVGKTHGLSTMTAAMKNLWGLLPEIRYKFHPVIHDAIAELNLFFDKVVLNVCDMTITQHGPGPRCGHRRVCDVVMVSTDRVAMDAAVATFMGFDPELIEYIQHADTLTIGHADFKIKGDPFYTERFKPSVVDDHFLYRWRKRIQKMPVIGDLVFKTHLYYLAVKFAEFYNKKIYYWTEGKEVQHWVLNETWYREEYESLISKINH